MSHYKQIRDFIIRQKKNHVLYLIKSSEHLDYVIMSYGKLLECVSKTYARYPFAVIAQRNGNV